MNTKNILVVDNNPETLDIICPTLREADVRFHVCSNSVEGWDLIRTNPEFTIALIRMNAENIDGCDLCQRIRNVKSRDQLPILMIVGEDQLEYAVNGLDAGASEILIDPFEARELRMRLNIVVASHRRRIDDAHAMQNGSGQPTVNHEEFELSAASVQSAQLPPQVVTPKFDPLTLRFEYGAPEAQVDAWMSDDSVTKVDLDKAMVCPCCHSVPSFRPGCGECGSAMTKQELLIHHYACAHIGSEADFRHENGLMCPKCRKTDLVAGSDFEVVSGGHVCTDCNAKISEPELIGHCLSCQHRFPAHEAVLVQLSAFHIPRVHAPESTVARKPAQARIRRLRSRHVRTT